MLVFRSDLLTGFKNKLFEIDVKDIDHFGLSLDDNILVCSFTSRVVKNGYKISGYILNNVLYNCDKCLDSFSINKKMDTELFLSNNTKVLERDNNTIYFSDREKSIDLKNILIEILLVEEPIRNLCTDTCKGLCISCGINLNNKICECN